MIEIIKKLFFKPRAAKKDFRIVIHFYYDNFLKLSFEDWLQKEEEALEKASKRSNIKEILRNKVIEGSPYNYLLPAELQRIRVTYFENPIEKKAYQARINYKI